jgi:uncharacterized protein
MRTSNYVVFVTIPQKEEHYLVHGYSGAVDQVKPEVVRYLLDRLTAYPGSHMEDVRNAEASLAGKQFGEPQDSTIEELYNRGYLTTKSPEEEREYVSTLSQRLHERFLRESSPGFLLIPTYDCIMRCPYCYASKARHTHTHGLEPKEMVMSREMTRGAFLAIDAIREAHPAPKKPAQPVNAETPGQKPAVEGDQCKVLRKGPAITLLGGEPLMASTVAWTECALPMSKERGFAMEAITNGVELDLFQDLLGPEDIRWIQVTLDGPRDHHDRTRRGPLYPDGTYDRILRNMRMAVERDCLVHVRVHANADTAHRMQEVFDDLDAQGLLNHKNLDIYVETTHSWDRGLPRPTYPDIAVADLLDRTRLQIPSRFSKGSVLPDYRVPAKLQSYIKHGLAGLCSSLEFCGANGTMYLLDLRGEIYPCWDITGMPEFSVGSFTTEGKVAIKEEYQGWRRRCPATVASCSACKYVFMHFSGCRAIPLRLGQDLTAPACY